jgi:peptidoglycan LD-endopeptidase LytH
MDTPLTPQLAEASLRLHHILNTIEAFPIFGEEAMSTPPHIFNLTPETQELEGVVQKGGEPFQEYINRELQQHNASWGIGRYLEQRDGVLHGTHIQTEGRTYHLGVDIAFPVGTPIFAPLDGEIFQSGYSSHWGDYGHFTSTRHEIEGIPFYLFYGHLHEGSYKTSGSVQAGDQIGILGDFHENGQWFHHTHLQVDLLPWPEGETPNGYCTFQRINEFRLLNPNPLYLIREYLPTTLPAN